jgi:hypothetical protein
VRLHRGALKTARAFHLSGAPPHTTQAGANFFSARLAFGELQEIDAHHSIRRYCIRGYAAHL